MPSLRRSNPHGFPLASLHLVHGSPQWHRNWPAAPEASKGTYHTVLTGNGEQGWAQLQLDFCPSPLLSALVYHSH